MALGQGARLDRPNEQQPGALEASDSRLLSGQVQ
jgi:hypothetical protein